MYLRGMSGFSRFRGKKLTDLEQAETRLQQYYNCETKLLTGSQEWTIGKSKFVRADLEQLRLTITEIKNEIVRLKRGGMRVRQGVPTG